MRAVVALGGNALLERGERPDSDIQESHIASAVDALKPLLDGHEILITHGNGPQVGVLAVESAGDPAVRLAADHDWDIREDGKSWRRVVPSPEPAAVVELETIRLLMRQGVIVVCAGGGGVPVVGDDAGRLRGVEAVVDKDLTAALLAQAVGADALLLLTDVEAVIDGYGTPEARPIRRATTAELRAMTFPDGSMGPKVEAVCRFVEQTGAMAAIGRLDDVGALLDGTAGTTIIPAEKEQTKMNGADAEQYGRIVVGVDGSEGSKDALRWAAQQANLTGTTLEAVIGWEYPAFYGWAAAIPDDLDYDKLAEHALDVTLDEVLGRYRPPWLRTRAVCRPPALALIEASRGANLLVVGSRGHGALADMLLGSVSTYCVHHAHCPVTVIRPTGHRTGR